MLYICGASSKEVVASTLLLLLPVTGTGSVAANSTQCTASSNILLTQSAIAINVPKSKPEECVET